MNWSKLTEVDVSILGNSTFALPTTIKTHRKDIFVLCLLKSMIVHPVFRSVPFYLLKAKIDDLQHEVYGYICPSHFNDVFSRCLQLDPTERPSFSEIRRSLVTQVSCYGSLMTFEMPFSHSRRFRSSLVLLADFKHGIM